MTKKTVHLPPNSKGVRFLFPSTDPQAAQFIYKPPNATEGPLAIPQEMEVKFAQKTVILDDWWLVGGTRLTRTLFRLRHPIVYSKRGLRKFYRSIKRYFFGDPPMRLANLRQPLDKK